jgi:hypothetical protein
MRNRKQELTLCNRIIDDLQVAPGVATVWSNKAADIATAHVLLGVLSLLGGTILSSLIIGARMRLNVHWRSPSKEARPNRAQVQWRHYQERPKLEPRRTSLESNYELFDQLQQPLETIFSPHQ